MNKGTVDTVLFGHAQQRIKMVLVGVDAAIGKQSAEVKPAAAAARVFHGLKQHRVAEQLAVFDHQVDLGDVHIHHAPGADVEMAHLAVSHLPAGQPDVLRGVTGLVVPDRAALLERLMQLRKPLQGTKFDFRESNDCVETTCPWGNRINVHPPDESRFGRIVLGMPYIEFDVRPGTAERIARFYREVMDALATVMATADVRKACVQVGEKQYWYFRETDAPEKPYDRHHVQIYITDFSGPHRRLKELGLLTVEVNDHEYRFKDVIDLDTREVLFTVEHEVRSQTHPLYGRPLVNRNPAQTNRNYRPGHDSISWAMA